MAASSIIPVLIASSGELKEERVFMDSVFNELNTLFNHIQLKPVKWEIDLASGSVEGGNVQEDINRKLLDACPIAIVLLYSKIGRYTQEEFERSMRQRKKVFLYIREGFSPVDESQAKVYLDLLKFKSQVNQDNRVLYVNYTTALELKVQLFRDLLLHIKEKYPFEDQSIMRLFNAFQLSPAETRCVNLIAILSSGFYSDTDIFQYFDIKIKDKAPLHLAMEDLLRKGVLYPDPGDPQRFKIQDVIRKNVVAVFDFDSPDYDSLINNLIKKLALQSAVLQVIFLTFIEDFLNALPTHRNKRTARLKEALSAYYINTFGFGSRPHMEKCRMLLEQLLMEDLVDDESETAVARRKMLLAQVLSGVADFELNIDVRQKNFKIARQLLMEISDDDFKKPLERLRYVLVKRDLSLLMEGPSKTSRTELETLFNNNPNYFNLITIAENDLFSKILALSVKLSALDLSEKIIKKIIVVQETEYGDQDFKLCKPFLDCGEILMANNNKDESIKCLKKARLLADHSIEEPTELKQLIDGKIAYWTTKFLP